MADFGISGVEPSVFAAGVSELVRCILGNSFLRMGGGLSWLIRCHSYTKPVLKAVIMSWKTSTLLARCKTVSVTRATPVGVSSRWCRNLLK